MALKINIKATRVRLDPSIRAAIGKAGEHVEKNSSGHTVDLLSVEVGRATEHHQKGQIFFAEFQLMHPRTRKAEFRAREQDENIITAIHAARDELTRQLRKAKDARRARARKV